MAGALPLETNAPSNESVPTPTLQSSPSMALNRDSAYITANSNSPNSLGNSRHHGSNISSDLSTADVSANAASLYFTAKSNMSALNTQLFCSGAKSNTTNISSQKHQQAKPGELQFNNTHLLEAPESLYSDQITHAPPYAPNAPVFSHLGKPSLRQAIMTRQSSRIIPVSNRVVEYMEDQLVRWRPPGSSFHADDILNGKHPFQQNNLPNHESKTAVDGPADTLNTSDTDSLVISIARSPFVNIGQSLLKRDHNLQATFREHNIGTPDPPQKKVKKEKDDEDDIEIQGDDDSIQESFKFHTLIQPNSGSASSSLIRNLKQSTNGESIYVTAEAQPPIVSTVQTTEIPSAKTFEAQPLEWADIELLLKNQPEPITNMLFNQQENEHTYNYLDDDLNKDCWSATIEVWTEMWMDCVDCFTCNFDTDPHRIYT